MRYALIFFLSTFLIVAGGCESQPAADAVDTARTPDDTTRGEDAQRADDGEANGGSASLGVSLAALLDGAETRAPETQKLPILDRLNEPDRISINTRINRHNPGQTDTLRTLHYRNARVTVYHVSGGKELLKSVEVTGQGLESPEGVHVGMTREKVESILGEPPQRQNGAYVYADDGPMPTHLYIYFQDGEVSEMEWLFPID